MMIVQFLLALAGNITLGIVLLLIATIVFDILHMLLHRFARSGYPVLQALGALHTTHHQFLDTDLRIHETFMIRNVLRHVIPEFVVQVTVTLALMPFFPALAVWTALVIEFVVFVVIMWGKPGFDVNHKHVEQLSAYKPLYFCVPEYHLLHHVYPLAYFSSWIKTLDQLLLTGTALQGRRVLLTDADSVFARTFASELEKAGAKVNAADVNALEHTDILLLCHQQKSDNDYRDIIDKFCQLHESRRLPVEIWARGSDTEFCDPGLTGYVQFARRLFGGGNVIYRHLVADQNMSEAELAKTFLKGIRRGFNYVPARYNLAMLKHYWQFVLK